MPNDLTGYLLGAAVVAFGATFLAHEGLGTVKLKDLTNLVVPRPAEAEYLSRLARTEGATFALNEHRQLSSDVVIFEDAKRAMRSNEPVLIMIKSQHNLLLTPEHNGGKR